MNMRFKAGTSSAATTSTQAEGIGLEFEANVNILTAIGSAIAPFDVVVQAFDPIHDIFYHTQEALTPEELAEEVEIHVPRTLLQKLNSRVVPGTLGGLVLMQHISTSSPTISPLAALKEVLEATGSVNFAILQADNGGILFVRNAGMQFHAGASAHSLKEFLKYSKEERERTFPDFHTSEIILSGYDLDLGPEITSRRVAISDFTPICEFASEAGTLVETNPHRYTLVIGAAAVYAEILQGGKSIQ
jgi:hypothetical protein